MKSTIGCNRKGNPESKASAVELKDEMWIKRSWNSEAKNEGRSGNPIIFYSCNL